MQNPSAFATRAAKNFLRAASIDLDGPMRFRGEALLRPEQFGLDEQATDFVLKLPPPQMQLVLENLQAEGPAVRSPSAYVTRIVKNLLRASRDAEGGTDMVEVQFSPPPPRSDTYSHRPLLSKPPDRHVPAAAERLRLLTPEEFGLDAAATEFLHKLPPNDMQRILGQLEEEGHKVRNPSGFVTRLARETVERNGGVNETRSFAVTDMARVPQHSLYGAVSGFGGFGRSRPY